MNTNAIAGLALAALLPGVGGVLSIGLTTQTESHTISGRLEVDRSEGSVSLFVRDVFGGRNPIEVSTTQLDSQNGLRNLEGRWVKVTIPSTSEAHPFASHIEIVTHRSAKRDNDPSVKLLNQRHAALDAIPYVKAGPTATPYHALDMGQLDSRKVQTVLSPCQLQVDGATGRGTSLARVYIGGDSRHYYLVSSGALLNRGDGVRIDEVREDAYALRADGRLMDEQVQPVLTPSKSTLWEPGDTLINSTMRFRVVGGDGRGRFSVAFQPFSTPTNAIVTNTADTGAGSLRNALIFLLSNPAQQIKFQIPKSDSGFNGKIFTIKPQSALPTIYSSSTIDGSQQRTFTGATNGDGPEIFLDGSHAGSSALGLYVDGANSFINEIGVINFGDYGLLVGANQCTIQRCYLGVEGDGLTAAPNQVAGIQVTQCSDCLIGGGTGKGNLVSGNVGYGISLNSTTSCRVLGNYAGCDASGMKAVPNTTVGIYIQSNANQNQIGSPNAGEGNLVSGNANCGISIYQSSKNIVVGNICGLNASRNAALPTGIGIDVYGDHNQIGGIGVGEGNICSGNSRGTGIQLNGSITIGNLIEGNFIGTDPGGSKALPNGTGVYVGTGATSNTIGGTNAKAANLISGNAHDGIDVYSTGTLSNVIQGNEIGTNLAGTAALPNQGTGINITQGASDTIIGGTTAGAGNLISGNSNIAIWINGPGCNGTKIEGNFIGTNKSGSAAIGNGSGVLLNELNLDTVIGTAGSGGNYIAGNGGDGIGLGQSKDSTIQGNSIGISQSGVPLANSQYGIEFFGGAASNTIGGTSTGTGNLISGNGYDGITIHDAGTNSNLIQGNVIGLGSDSMGSTADGNDGSGVSIYNGASNNTVGGSVAGAGNIVCANSYAGITIQGAATLGNSIQGNRIGLTANGSAVGNKGSGIEIDSAANTIIGNLAPNILVANQNGIFLNGATGTWVLSNRIGVAPNGASLPNTNHEVWLTSGATNCHIGAPGEGNTIGGALGNSAITVQDATTLQNPIRGNAFIGTAQLNVDLVGNDGPYGVTPNNPGNTDTGPDGLQNYPILTSAGVSSGQASLTGTFNSKPNLTYTVDVYTVTAQNVAQHGGAQRWIGSFTVTTNASGNATISHSVAFSGPADYVCLQATNPSGDSSEMGPNQKI